MSTDSSAVTPRWWPTAVAEGLRNRGAASSGWRESIDAERLRHYEPGTGVAPDGRLDPRSVAERIAALLPQDRVVVSDGGHFLGWVNMFWPVAAPDRMMTIGTAYQSIGLGFLSVAGAARAKPESTIVLATGDGGGLMALAELETAVRVAAGRGIAVVWNDAAYSAEVTLYGRAKGLALEPMLIPEVDFAALGDAVGAEGVVVRTLERPRSARHLGRRAGREPPLPRARLPDLGRDRGAVPAGDHPRELVARRPTPLAHRDIFCPRLL